jgi:hypothetical protein
MRHLTYHIIKYFDDEDNCISETVPIVSYTKEMILETKYKFGFYRYEIETIAHWELDKFNRKYSRKKKSEQILNNKVSSKFLN